MNNLGIIQKQLGARVELLQSRGARCWRPVINRRQIM
jgi:hypothetical protein